MRGLSLIACAAGLAGSAISAIAQEPAPQPSKPRTPAPSAEACTAIEPGRIECRRMLERSLPRLRMDSAFMKRAALGLQLNPTGTARDTLGVFVSAVTPKGPAENAGIIEGDRIVSINGVDLRVARGDIEDGYASGLPAHRLQREVANLTPGSRVNLRVYSGGRVRDVQVTAARASDLMRSRGLFIGGGEGFGNTYIFRDGMEMPPMMPMPPMGTMPPMEPMGVMPAMPPMERMAPMLEMERMAPMLRMEGMKLRSLPRMRLQRGEVERLRMLAPSRIRSPRRTYRIRNPSGLKTIAPNGAKLREELKAKIRSDSIKNRTQI